MNPKPPTGPDRQPAASTVPSTVPSTADSTAVAGIAPAAEPLAVVAIGASAGALAALRLLLAHIPADSGLSYVIVVHLSPHHESMLPELLQPHACIPVLRVVGTMPLQRDHIYVIPPGSNLNSIDTHLRLSPLEEHRRERAPIDHFFRTLADTHDGESVAVVMTGTGSDGALGLKEIKARKGLTVAQDPHEAEFRGMPQSAIETGLVDLVLPVAQIPGQIIQHMRKQPRVCVPVGEHDLADDRQFLQSVMHLVRSCTGRDFSNYKPSTILRRIHRRMQWHGIQQPHAYLHLLRQNAEETRALADEFLITVSSFFRDAEVFDHLERAVIPRLFERKGPLDCVRVWSVGCATGEEAYSLAILLQEAASLRQHPPRIQVVASDLHEGAIRAARQGVFASAIQADIAPQRLQRFFVPEPTGFSISNAIREQVIFAPHNLLTDPPFSHIDLVACRNLLIYLQRPVQQNVLRLFHDALNPGGYLVLGSSEAADCPDLFANEHNRLRIFRKDAAPPQPGSRMEFPAAQDHAHPTSAWHGVRIRVVLVEDHPLVRRGIINVLHTDGRIDVVGEACDGVQAIEVVARLQPQVVLMDVNLPRMNGIEATRTILRRQPAPVIIGLTVQHDEPTARAMLAAGAAAFLSKSGDAVMLVETILALAHRVAPAPAE